MSSRKPSRAEKKKSNPMLMALAALVPVLALAVIFISQQSGASAATRLTPASYNEQFLSAGQDHFLLDVRTPQEFAEGYIEGAELIPVDSLSSRLDEVPKDKPVVVYCRSGNRSRTAAQILTDAGYTNVYDLGGIIDWAGQGFPVVK